MESNTSKDRNNDTVDQIDSESAKWVIPYVDQPMTFWQQLKDACPGHVQEVYLPLSYDIISSGEPVQPSKYKNEFLKSGIFKTSALLNPLTLSCPVEEIVPRVIEELKRLKGEYDLFSATIANLTLAMRIREAIPDMFLTASCLMQISKPNQVEMLNGLFDNLVPAPLIMRDLPSLKSIKQAFNGKIRLLVNECCLPGCPYRVQHFYEMGCNLPHPLSLCNELLNKHHWMRMTGGWVLPQHLHLYDGVYDDLKLGGRVTLRKPEKYLHVLGSYVNRKPLLPNQIGGGPGMVRIPINITEEYYAKTLNCRQQCHSCTICQDYFSEAAEQLMDRKELS